MAVWSKALPLTASYLSTLSGFESQSGQVKKLPVTWGQAIVLAWYSGFLHQFQLAGHDFATIWQKVTKNEIPKISNHKELYK